MRWFILAMLIGWFAPAAAQNADTDYRADDLIHADLPLFGSGTEDMWPQHIDTSDGDIGCTSRVAFGTWKLQWENDYRDPDWYRIANYGAFHCFALVSDAPDRKQLARRNTRPSFFILLDKTRDRELWALQLGGRPGSDYVLLSRKPDKGIIKRFDVLQRDCPVSFTRKGTQVEILITSYCAINSPNDLVTLARTMAKRPPLGSLTYIDDDTKIGD